MYIPLFGILKFIFYFGWLNVAETLINPFGEDDEDFDVNYLINRNLQLAPLSDQSSLFQTSKTTDIILLTRFIFLLSFFGHCLVIIMFRIILNIIMDSIRNLQIGYLMVEGASEEEALEDPYQGGLPTCLPHTLESFKVGSCSSPGFPKRGCAPPFSRHGADPVKYRPIFFACGNQGFF